MEEKLLRAVRCSIFWYFKTVKNLPTGTILSDYIGTMFNTIKRTKLAIKVRKYSSSKNIGVDPDTAIQEL